MWAMAEAEHLKRSREGKEVFSLELASLQAIFSAMATWYTPDDRQDGIDGLNASAGIGRGGVAHHRSAAAYKHTVCRLEQRRSG